MAPGQHSGRHGGWHGRWRARWAWLGLGGAAFAKIAPLSAGLVPVSYQTVADPPLPGPVSLRVKEGSSQYWLALLAANTGNPLASVQVEDAAGKRHDLTRADYNYWIAASGAGPVSSGRGR